MISSAEFLFYPNRPLKLTPEFVRSEYERLSMEIEGAEKATTVSVWVPLYRKWDSLKCYVSSEYSRASFLYAGKLNDLELEKTEKYLREEVLPIRQKGDSVFTEAVLNSRHRDEIGKALGEQLLNVLETHVKPLDPRISDFRVEESKLSSSYRKLSGNAEAEYEGIKYTLTQLENFRSSSEVDVRRNSFLAHRSWFKTHRNEIAENFSNLVKLRQKMGEAVGDENFISLGYLRMGRTDYGVAESAEFRRLVREHVVPVQTLIHADQARALGQPTLRPWDIDYHPSLVLPMDVCPIDSQLEKAQRIFDRMSPKLSHHFSMMREAELIDLENRPGKAPGAFCTTFMDQSRTAIFCNSTGGADDIRTLMHEMGHAFQQLESIVDGRVVDLTTPTMDAAEVHSMGMEYLSLSRMDEFFTPAQASKFSRQRWKHSIELICYVAIVDEFQHWVYTNVNASFDERDGEWVRLVSVYQPSVDYSGYETLIPLRWYKQAHLFNWPFYYIDYAIADMGAMQLSLLDAKDPKKALEVYLDLCHIGGNLSVLKVFKAAGLESPFSEESMRKLMVHARTAVLTC